MNKSISKMIAWINARSWCVFLFLCCTVVVFAQQDITITGTVTDNGDPLPGVTVLVKGTIIGTATNADGRYQIVAPNTESVLQFSFVGYITSEVMVGMQRIINVDLVEDTQQLEEVVVIGYGVQRKATITGAIVSMGNEELLKTPTTSLSNALAGRLPGFSSIQYSGLPGYDDPTIFVRGIGTLSSGASTPLILVDGVERSFTQIDPNEVSDISILKDASATAVFGVRGANGVILVTTKRGESGKAKITASGSIGIQQPTHLVRFADSYTYATIWNRAQETDGVPREDWTFSDEAIEMWRTMKDPICYPSVDWVDYVMAKYAMQHQYNINVSGGNDRARYFVSFGKLFQDGLFKTFNTDPRSNFKYNRYNFRTNLDVNLSKTTTLSINVGGRIEDRNTTGDSASDSNREGNIYSAIVSAQPMSGAGIIDGKRVVGNSEYVGVNLRGDGLAGHYAKGYKTEVTNVLNLDLQLVQNLNRITHGLSFKVKGSYNSSFIQMKERTQWNNAEYIPWKINVQPDGSYDIGFARMGEDWGKVLGYDESYSFRRDWYFETSFDYQRKFFGKHNLTALLLYNQTKRYYPGSYTDIPTGYVGLVGRITYDYAMRYLLDLNMGYNGSENFAKGKRYGFFPSVSLGWIITSEEFMKNQNILDYLKIRYSYGIVGSDYIRGNRFLYLPPAFENGTPTIFDANTQLNQGYNFGITNTWQPGVREASLGNPDVTWEKAKKQNFGLDVKTFNNRLGLNVDVFMENRWDILIDTESMIPVYMGLPNTPPINYGKVDNHGFEIALLWTDRVGSDFSYTIAPNMSFHRNKIIEMAEIKKNYDYQYVTGHKVDQPFGYEFFGFYEGPETEQAYIAKYQPKSGLFPKQRTDVRPGDCVYVDLNDDDLIDGEDKWAIGYPNYPEYTFGLTLSLKIKRFDVSMLWVGSLNCNRNLERGYRPPFGQQFDSALLQYVADNSWTEETARTAILPRISFNNNNFISTERSGVWLKDSSYGRLKNMEIAYNFKVDALTWLSSARIYLTGYNLITFTNYKANDPENVGNEFRYPQTRVVNAGITVSF